MDELNKKIEHLEKIKQDKIKKQKEEEDSIVNKEQKKQEGVKNFLSNIQTFEIEDI